MRLAHTPKVHEASAFLINTSNDILAGLRKLPSAYSAIPTHSFNRERKKKEILFVGSLYWNRSLELLVAILLLWRENLLENKAKPEDKGAVRECCQSHFSTWTQLYLKVTHSCIFQLLVIIQSLSLSIAMIFLLESIWVVSELETDFHFLCAMVHSNTMDWIELRS